MVEYLSSLGELARMTTIPPYNPKVVGGNFALPNEFPYQLQLKQKSGFHSCGATLISTLLVVTAAHCVDDIDTPEDVKVLSGQHITNQIDGTEQSRVARKIIIHEDYDPKATSNDIAMLLLSDDFNLDAHTNIALVPQETTKFRALAYTTGWGVVQERGGDTASALKKAPVPLVSLEECRKLYNDTQYIVANKTICAGAKGLDACQGDSGGPLTCIGENGLKYFCGIVSWGRGCARKGFPTIYTEVSKFSGWIQTQIQKLREEGLCPPPSSRCSFNTEYLRHEKAPLLANRCAMDQFHCRLSHKCIPLAFRCDEDYDCGTGDHSDERGCPSIGATTPQPCGPYAFQCKVTGRCIPLNFICDGDKDCGEEDISDENDCKVKCNSSSEFACVEHHVITKCIPRSYLCNGVNDCGGNMDEAYCNPKIIQANCSESCSRCPFYFECRISKICINSRSICDKHMDCGEGDSSDEDNCGVENGCHRDQFACTNGTNINKCIPFAYVCDGDRDCGDNSDEQFCNNTEGFRCNSRQFTCLTDTRGFGSRCIPESYRCNGYDDCGDNSDEINCSNETTSESSSSTNSETTESPTTA